jgi:hypothetical protein
VLRRGLIKRVGPREINVWQENWIPGLWSLKPLIRLPAANAERVSDLFVPGTCTWDEDAVRKSFMALEAVEVLKIKPSACLEHENNGFYSVRSAYRLLKEDQMAAAMATTGKQWHRGTDTHGVRSGSLVCPRRFASFGGGCYTIPCRRKWS